MNNRPIGFNLSLAQAMESYPQLVRIFLKYHTRCVGCLMAAFCNFDDAVQQHNLEGTEFIQEVEACIHAHVASKD